VNTDGNEVPAGSKSGSGTVFRFGFYAGLWYYVERESIGLPDRGRGTALCLLLEKEGYWQ